MPANIGSQFAPSAAMSDRTERFIRYFTGHEPRIHAYILTLVPDWNDAADIAQATSAVLWEKFDTFAEGTNFLAWAFNIARIEVASFRRKQSRERIVFSEELLDAVAEEARGMDSELEDQQRKLAECLAKLRPADRQLLDSRYRPGGTVKSLAGEIGRTVDAAYKALSRIRAWLLHCVERGTDGLSEKRSPGEVP